MPKRNIEVLVLSDIHLGTYGCHAKELLNYLKSIKPQKIILNGDIIDIWQFSKNYWPESHMKIIRRIMKYISNDVPVYYLTGNHDELLRKFTDMEWGSLRLCNKLVLELDEKKAWFFHGDIFDVTMQYSKWLAKLGAIGYDTLILLNTFVNFILTSFGKEKMSFSKKIKSGVKNAVKFINNFEAAAAEIAIEKEYDYVICGHIHQAERRIIKNDKGSVLYLNSGDWVESLTSLEYYDGQWRIFSYRDDYISVSEEDADNDDDSNEESMKLKTDIKQLYENLVGSPLLRNPKNKKD